MNYFKVKRGEEYIEGSLTVMNSNTYIITERIKENNISTEPHCYDIGNYKYSTYYLKDDEIDDFKDRLVRKGFRKV